MATVQRRVPVLIAVLALVVGCAFAFIVPSQQAYAVNTTLAAGSTFERATNLPLTGKDLKSSNKTTFNATTDNNFYKFTTSSRDSRYKLSLRSYKGFKIYVTVYDSGHHRIASMSTTSTKGQTWTFRNLKRNSVYYVELWRFVVDGANYLYKGTVLDMGYAETAYPPYRFAVKEIVVKPSLTSVRAVSKKKNHMTIAWDQSFNTEQVQIEFYWAWQEKSKKNTWIRYSKKAKYTTWVRYNGKTHPYKIRVRPFMTANGKRVYGKWVTPTYINNWNTKSQTTKYSKLYIKSK